MSDRVWIGIRYITEVEISYVYVLDKSTPFQFFGGSDAHEFVAVTFEKFIVMEIFF